MKKVPALAAALCLFTASHGLFGQESADPTMNPGSEKKPFGFAGIGKERPKDAKTEITARKQATFDNAANVATFEGNVVVKDPQFTLFCDRLVVTLNPERKGMKLTEAFGNVVIVQENTDAGGRSVKSTGRAGKAVYEPVSGNVTLSVTPSIQHDRNMQIGEPDTIMILNRSGTSETKGVSKTVIVDTSAEQ